MNLKRLLTNQVINLRTWPTSVKSTILLAIFVVLIAGWYYSCYFNLANLASDGFFANNKLLQIL